MKIASRPLRLCVASALFILFTGCTVMPTDTAQLAAEVAPESWSSKLVAADGERLFSDFWGRWNDSCLLELVERSRKVNTDVLVALANLRSARASVITANSLLWPNAELGVDANRQRSLDSTNTNYSADFSGTWTLNLAGAEYQKRQAEVADAEAAMLTLESTRELVAAQTAQAYINLRVAQRQCEIVQQSILNYEETVKIADWQYRAGTGSASEAADARAQWFAARARLPEITRSVQAYKSALARLTSQPVDHLLIPSEGAVPMPPRGGVESIPAETIMRRPDVQAAMRTLEASLHRLQGARRDFFPSLRISGNVGTAAGTISALGNSATGIAGLIGALSLPILNWGTLVAAEETAAAQLDLARSGYVSTLLTALEETDNAITGIVNAERRTNNLKEALQHAQTASALARLEYESGVGEYTMLLSSERSRLSAEESLLTNQAEYANQYVALYRALGGAWVFERDLNMQKEVHDDRTRN